MTKEEFIAEIETQKARGKALLKQVQQLYVVKNNYGDGSAVFGTPRLYYTPSEELEPVKNEYESWKCYVHDLLLSVLDEDDDFISEWDLCLQQPYRHDISDKDWYFKEIKEALSKLDSFVQRIGFRLKENTMEPETPDIGGNKSRLLFISHSSSDETIVAGLVEMLRTIGFNNKNLFCSSVPGYDIPEGEDIYDFLQEKLRGYELFVVFVLSESYYESAACLNEMGAAWVLKANYSTIILPGFQIPNIKGAVNPRKMAIVLEDDKRVRGKLNQLKDRLIDFFDLPDIEDDIIWETDRNKFIDIVIHNTNS